MESAVDAAATKASAKLRALLRARKYMSLSDVVLQLKAQILCLLEYLAAAVYHASDTVLFGLDRVQARFSREVGLSEADAFLKFSFRPL